MESNSFFFSEKIFLVIRSVHFSIDFCLASSFRSFFSIFFPEFSNLSLVTKTAEMAIEICRPYQGEQGKAEKEVECFRVFVANFSG